MPLLASIYAAFLSFIAIHSLYQHVTDRERLWFTFLDFVADICLFVVFVLYWFPHSSRTLGLTSVAMFLFALLWFIGWTPYHLSKFTQKDVSPEENRLFKRFVHTVAIMLTFPGYWFGGLGVFKSL